MVVIRSMLRTITTDRGKLRRTVVIASDRGNCDSITVYRDDIAVNFTWVIKLCSTHSIRSPVWSRNSQKEHHFIE